MKKRLYDQMILDHLSQNRQMIFLAGPRQVGKTTAAQKAGDHYFNWDRRQDRRQILDSKNDFFESFSLNSLSKNRPVIVLDELHKYTQWKSYLKGIFDTHEKSVRLIVTGSAQLDLFRKGGDSLMGRYFLYRMHPWSVAEIIRTDVNKNLISPPQSVSEENWKALWLHGGFPEPYLRREQTFTRRWRKLRFAQMSQEDLRDLTRIQELGGVETLMQILSERSAHQLVYSTLASEVSVSIETVQRWIHVFQNLHFGFLLRPWHRGIANSLRKEPKWYLRDWSGIEEDGARAETFIACHLLKAVEGWTDLGLGDFSLYYLRDKQKREVDFLIVRDKKPWLLVEVKKSETTLSPSLKYFHEKLSTEHAFQVVTDLDYVDSNPFEMKRPVVVPAKTLLSQLL